LFQNNNNNYYYYEKEKKSEKKIAKRNECYSLLNVGPGVSFTDGHGPVGKERIRHNPHPLQNAKAESQETHILTSHNDTITCPVFLLKKEVTTRNLAIDQTRYIYVDSGGIGRDLAATAADSASACTGSLHRQDPMRI
jgi:hypothetical protein